MRNAFLFLTQRTPSFALDVMRVLSQRFAGWMRRSGPDGVFVRRTIGSAGTHGEDLAALVWANYRQ
jgi:hypothetical protein